MWPAGTPGELAAVQAALAHRDRYDSSRAHAPLAAAATPSWWIPAVWTSRNRCARCSRSPQSGGSR